MNRITRKTKILTYAMLILISVSSFCFLGDQPIAYIIALIPIGLIILFIAYFIIEKRTRETRNMMKIAKFRKEYAKIIAVDYHIDLLIMQLKISNGKIDYTTSLIINKPDQEMRRAFSEGESIEVWVNPKNQHDITMINIYEKSVASRNVNWITILVIFLNIFIFTISPIVDYINPKKQFQDIAVINTTDKPDIIWEIQYSSPKSIYIKIYDPLNDKKIKTIKDKKEKEFDNNITFFISQQKKNVLIVGTGSTPVFDIYDASSYKKIADIKNFEKSNTIFSTGISSIKHITSDYWYNNDDMIELTTNDANKCYYNIQQDKFLYSENDFEKHIEDLDSFFIGQQMFVFALSSVSDHIDKRQLYIIETNDKKGIETLKTHEGINILDVDNFNNNKKYNHCNLIPLCSDTFFLRGNIIYIDSTMAIVHHVNSVNKNAEELISGIHKSGKQLFRIYEADYPNLKDMKKDEHKPHNHIIKSTRISNKIVLLFGKYGALCVDVKSGKIIWKYEP